MAQIIFDVNMDAVDPEDAGQSMATIDAYIRYMAERIEHVSLNTQARVEALEKAVKLLAGA